MAAAVLATGSIPASASAQGEGPGTHRKWLIGAIAAVIVGVPSFASDDFGLRLGGCASRECFAPIATVAGFTAGFLIGKELDEAAARRFVAGPATELVPTGTIALPFVPHRGRPFSAGALFLGPESIVMLEGGSARTFPGVRGVSDATVPAGSGAIVGSTPGDLFAISLREPQSPARRVSDRGGRRLATGPGGDLVLSGVGGLRRFTVSRGSAGIELEQQAETPGIDPAAELVWPAGSDVLWVLDGARLVAISAGSLVEVGALDLPASPTSLDVRGGLALAAAGRNGVYVLDVSDPRFPRLVATYRGVRDPRDAALLRSRGYVAAGEQGLVVLDLEAPSRPSVDAVVRNLGLPSLVVPGDGHVWVVDQMTGEVHRIPGQ